MGARSGERPLRVALLSDWFAPRRGGIETQLAGLARALIGRGVEATVITSLPGDAIYDGVPVIRLPTPLLPGAQIAWSPRLVATIQGALAEGDFNLVHAHPSVVAPVCLAGLIAARRLGLPVLLTFHSSLGVVPFWLGLLDKATGWTAQGVTLGAVSAVIAGQVQRIAPGRPVLVMPNGHDHAFWSGARPHTGAGPVFRVVTAMRLARTKRPMALLNVLRRAGEALAGRGVTLELVVAGEGRYAGRMARAAQSSSLSAQLRLRGWRPPQALRELYERSNLFLLPSTKEAFGIAALEARAAGLPVVGRRGTGLEDFITDQDGVLCDSDEACAEAIIQLATDRAALSRLAGPRPGLGRYDWAAVAADHERLYRAALTGPRIRGRA
ncbi:hypothetical protein SLNSH_04320 [Alsobacter soli]|uniref:Glycosyltransferase family 1 protein n=1 Tax=Alsobacter soli TaxID=2109933 RepID=A0A2T1HYD8_9HYPH|nr:glycosyltransferase family 4 protein [Alsobacter soli]PSC06509.1 hypothetical protein SLNSH_04320 [Alsobacter soli]